MANSVLVSDILTAARQRADMENSAFVTDTEVIRMIDRSFKKLYRWIVGKFENYYLSSTPLTLVSGQAIYSLPADFYKLVGVDLARSGRTYTVLPFNFNERNKGQGALNAFSLFSDFRYILEGSNIKFTQAPQTTDTVTLWYVPVPVVLTSGTQTVDVILGFDELVTVDVAIALLEKEESDASALMAERAQLLQDLEGSLATRDAGLPTGITDVRTDFDLSLPWGPGL